MRKILLEYTTQAVGICVCYLRSIALTKRRIVALFPGNTAMTLDQTKGETEQINIFSICYIIEQYYRFPYDFLNSLIDQLYVSIKVLSRLLSLFALNI